MNTIEAIKKRISVRDFKKENFDDIKEELIDKLIEECNSSIGPFNHSSRIQKISIDSKLSNCTYGVITNPKYFIAGACTDLDNSIVDYGYKLEKLVIELVKEGIGNCWVSDTFKRKTFETYLNIDSLEIMPAIIAIGLEKEVVHKHIEKKHWKQLFFRRSFTEPLKESEAFMFRLPLEMLRLSPSSSNEQPWRILLSDDLSKVHFYYETRVMKNNMLNFEIQLLDIGIAMFHFEETCKDLAVEGKWKQSDPNIDLPNENYKYLVTYE